MTILLWTFAAIYALSTLLVVATAKKGGLVLMATVVLNTALVTVLVLAATQGVTP